MKEIRKNGKHEKNPVLMGILSAVGVAAGILLIELVFSLIRKQNFGDQFRDPVTLIILIVGSIASSISTYLKTKNEISGKKG